MSTEIDSQASAVYEDVMSHLVSITSPSLREQLLALEPGDTIVIREYPAWTTRTILTRIHHAHPGRRYTAKQGGEGLQVWRLR